MARRRHLWTPHNSGSTVAASATIQTTVLSALDSGLLATGGLTVSRIIGEFKFRVDVVNTYQQFNLGIGVFHEDRVINVNDFTEANNLWMFTLYTRTSGLLNEVAAGDFDGIEEVRSIDIRVSRKIPAQHTLDLVISNGAGQTLNFNLGIRTLVLLP